MQSVHNIRLQTTSFNSLQTGTAFWTGKHNFTTIQRGISIPFKREGLSERKGWDLWSRLVLCFNSLQTGRSFRTCHSWSRHYLPNVSIPFKREGLSERHQRDQVNREAQNDCFNSLQTGRSFRTYPPTNPVTVRAKLAKTKHELRGGFLWTSNSVKLPLIQIAYVYESTYKYTINYN